MPPKSTVIVPLYIYPFPNAWDQLYEAICDYPTVDFMVILNPHNGPGEPILPDENYTREIPRLNALPNVCTIGYVRVNYCKRDLTEVCHDVAKYSRWEKESKISGLAVHGIFIDETPNLYDDEKARYLDTLGRYVKDTSGILGDRTVIHNPGTAPDAGYANPGPDVTTVMEESFERWQSVAVQHRLSMVPYDNTRSAYMVHSVPINEVRGLVRELRHRGKYLFVTDLQEHYYVQFGTCWSEFVDAMHSE